MRLKGISEVKMLNTNMYYYNTMRLVNANANGDWFFIDWGDWVSLQDLSVQFNICYATVNANANGDWFFDRLG